MLSILLTTIAAFFMEISCSVGKFAMAKKWESPQLMSLLNNSWTVAYFAAIAVFVPGSFVVAPKSVPILALLVVLNALQTAATAVAIQTASRSTFSFIRTLTIPLLAVIDFVTTSTVSPLKFLAMFIMFGSIAWLHHSHGIDRKGAIASLFSAVNAAIALALIKYVLVLGTSVAATEIILLAPVVAGLAIWSHTRGKLKPATKHGKLLIAQTASYSLASLIQSYAMLLAPASVITAASRSASTLWSIAFGQAMFKEKHLHEKLLAGVGVIVGFMLLTV